MPKVDEIDFKTGESVAPEVGQTETTEIKEEAPKEETKAEETKEETQEETKEETTEDVDSLNERLKKLEEEKENYKKGMLKYKDLTLRKPEKEKEEESEEEYPEWDENSKKFQQQTLSQAEAKAEAKAQAIVEGYNEKTAIAQFVEKNPELAEESKWSEIIANYTPTHGKSTPKDVLKDLNRALLLTRYDNGEIDKISAEAEQKGKSKGKAEAQLANMSSVSKTTSKTGKEGNTLSPGALKLAEKMRVDTKKLAEEDDSNTAEIKL